MVPPGAPEGGGSQFCGVGPNAPIRLGSVCTVRDNVAASHSSTEFGKALPKAYPGWRDGYII